MDILHSQQNADQTNKANSSTEPWDILGLKKDEKLIERDPIPGTPFWMIREDEKYWITLGRYRLNQTPIADKEDVQTYLLENTYNIMLMMISINDQISKLQKPKQ